MAKWTIGSIAAFPMFVSENNTPFLAEAFSFQDKHCVKSAVTVVRATFDVKDDGQCTVSDEQSPFVYADAHYGDPEVTSVRAESDFVPVKPRAEVVLDAVAMAPHRAPTEELEVALLGPSLKKHAIVVGERRWVRAPLGIRPTRPAAFTSIPLAWHLAFGGTDRSHADPSGHRSDPRNPVGRGFLTNSDPDAIDGTPLPCIEDPASRVFSTHDRPTPIGFGPVPRFAADRARFAGTYDQHWADHVLPFLPQDFDDRYFQAAPADQQLERLAEGMGFMCVNMSPAGKFLVRLPAVSVPVRFVFEDAARRATLAPDTLIIEPHNRRIVLLGRAGVRLPRKITRLREIKVGSPKPRAAPGKPRYGSLAETLSALANRRR